MQLRPVFVGNTQLKKIQQNDKSDSCQNTDDKPRTVNKQSSSMKRAAILGAMLCAAPPTLAKDNIDTTLISNPRVVNLDFSKITKENYWQSLTPKQKELALKIENYEISSLYRTGKTLPLDRTFDVRYKIGLRGVGIDYVLKTLKLYNTLQQSNNAVYSIEPLMSPEKKELQKKIKNELEAFTKKSGCVLKLNRGNLNEIAKRAGAGKDDMFFVGLVIQEETIMQKILAGVTNERYTPVKPGNYSDIQD